MSSPKYLASVDNSTVCQPASDESPILPRSVESLDLSPAALKRLERLCYEVYRTLLQYSNRGQLGEWDDLDEMEKYQYSSCVRGVGHIKLEACGMQSREQFILYDAIISILYDWGHVLEHKDAPGTTCRRR
jgi:hypothetical protein